MFWKEHSITEYSIPAKEIEPESNHEEISGEKN